jgi:23S rRNA (cytosine1962-C5)-methyltransferase
VNGAGQPRVVLGPRASQLAHKGRPWFYEDDLATVEAAHGDLVRARDEGGRDLGLGLYSETSRLRLRLCGPWPGDGVPEPEEFFATRLRDALGRRAALAGPRAGVRLVHGEADWLPGLVVDRYAQALVVQVTAAPLERHLGAIVPFLAEQTGAAMVLARNDSKVRRLEGLVEEVRLLHGQRLEEVVIEEHGVLHVVQPWAGQKTGFYLDQRPARARVQQLAKGLRVLDAFSYQGGFALAALAGGAASVLAVDESEGALARAAESAQRNGFPAPDLRAENAFTALRGLREAGAQFDLVVVDPPAFAKSRKEVGGAVRGYRDLNRLALRLLAPDGWLLTCSCSHHVTLPMFEDVLRQAAAGLPFRVFLRERLGAGPDHPVWVSLPESEYLKGCLLQRS